MAAPPWADRLLGMADAAASGKLTFEALSRQLREIGGDAIQADGSRRWSRPIRERVTRVLLQVFAYLESLRCHRSEVLREEFEQTLHRQLGHRQIIFKYGYGRRDAPMLNEAAESERYDGAFADLQQLLHSAHIEFPEHRLPCAELERRSPKVMKRYVAERLGISPKTLDNKISALLAKVGASKGDPPIAPLGGGEHGLPWVIQTSLAGEWLVADIDVFEEWLVTPVGKSWKWKVEQESA